MNFSKQARLTYQAVIQSVEYDVFNNKTVKLSSYIIIEHITVLYS